MFFSDIEGLTALNAALGDAAWVRLLIAHDTQVRAHVERRNGHIVKSQGDGFMVVFGSPVDAVKAGLGIQRSLADLRGGWRRRTPLTVRIGIHEGTAIARNGDLFGQTVAMAARVGARAQGDEILVTRPVADALDRPAPVRADRAGGRRAEGASRDAPAVAGGAGRASLTRAVSPAAIPAGTPAPSPPASRRA